MNKNVGTLDRNMRFVIGAIMIVLGYYVHFSFYIVGGLVILTGIFRICTLYNLFGINTNKEKR